MKRARELFIDHLLTTQQAWRTQDLAKQFDVCRAHAHRILKRMRDQGAVHIVRWERQQGSPQPWWALGPGEDAPRPPKWDQAQYMKDRRRRAQ